MMNKLLFFLICELLISYDINADCGCNVKRDNNIGESVLMTNAGQAAHVFRSQEEYVYDKMSLIPGGEYNIGTDKPIFPADNETDRRVLIADFYLDKYEVSNRDYKEFVDATNYETEAEKFGDSFIFKTLLSEEMRRKYKDFRVVNAEWWYKVDNVSWRNPHGPSSDLEGLWNHPVVHISWNDAVAYCQWMNKRLPNEAEWEIACRGGKQGKLFPWGNKLMPNDNHWLNIWQGEFPDGNTIEDGFALTCPVQEFRQNKYGLHNMVGNVWEWTQSFWDDKSSNPGRVKKGGSYLCHKKYCYRYRCAARSHNTADSSAGNLGFRCARDL